jgi:hypothetical protein
MRRKNILQVHTKSAAADSGENKQRKGNNKQNNTHKRGSSTRSKRLPEEPEIEPQTDEA